MKKALILFIISVMILISLLIIKSYTKSTEPPPKRALKSIESLVPPAPKKPIKKERINDTQRETREEMVKRIKAMSSEERRKMAEEFEAKDKMYKEKRENCREKCRTIPCEYPKIDWAGRLQGAPCFTMAPGCYSSCMHN